MKKILLSVLGFMFFATPAFCALSAVTASPGADDVYEINNATPGTSKTFLGTRLRGPLTIGSTTYASGENGNPSLGVSGCGGDYATPTTAVFFKTTGASVGESYCLGDGYANQQLTLVLTTDGGRDFTVTPATKTGFASVALNDANDSVTLRFSDTTKGWFVVGNNGATIN